MSSTQMIVEKTDASITFTRLFDAPRELVFEAFSKAEHIKEWWGPDEWPVSYCTLDFHPGGVWHYSMQSKEGQEVWTKAIYQEIVWPERIVYINGLSDAAGNDDNTMQPALVTATLTEQADLTKLVLHLQYATAADLEVFVARGMADGFAELFIHLDTYVIKIKGGMK